MLLAFLVPSVLASTPRIDGISDQSIPSWDSGFGDSYFAKFFVGSWINSGAHIRYARYVIQWNSISGAGQPYVHYREQFVAWLSDIASMGLIPDVALTSYNGVYPSSSAEYKIHLKEILNEAKTQGHPVQYLEAWNEPNGQGGESAASAAHFDNTAHSTCGEEHPGCTVIAGNVEDNLGAKTYEETYRANLDHTPVIWGIHPYYSVEYEDESYYKRTLEGIPNDGVGERIWFSEVAARRCTASKDNGEAGQADRAKWLVNMLMGNHKPEHVFYWEFLFKEHRQPTCRETDAALYVPSRDPYVSDAPRPAAVVIDGGAGFPHELNGGAIAGGPEPSATLTGSVPPGPPWGG